MYFTVTVTVLAYDNHVDIFIISTHFKVLAHDFL